MGHAKLVDVMLRDGLWDCFVDCHMGNTAETLAARYQVARGRAGPVTRCKVSSAIRRRCRRIASAARSWRYRCRAARPRQ